MRRLPSSVLWMHNPADAEPWRVSVETPDGEHLLAVGRTPGRALLRLAEAMIARELQR